MQSNHRRAEATARTLAGEYGGTHRVGRAKAFILRTSALRFSPRPGSCRERPRRVTTSWSIPNSPPDGPQVFTCGPFVCFASDTQEVVRKKQVWGQPPSAV